MCICFHICMFTSWCVCVCVWFETCDGVPTCYPVEHRLSPHYHFSLGLFWCSEPHQRGLWLGGRGVGGGLAPLRSFLPPPQGARHSVYQWQAKPDDEAACTANAVFEQGRGLPRHAEHTHTRRKGLLAHTRMHISIRPAPGGFDTCLEDAAEVNVRSLI